MAKTRTDFTRREMLRTTGMAGLAALTGTASGAAQAAPTRPRIACLVTYWGATRSHADWIVTKLLDGYWWEGAHTPSRVDVVSVYIHQLVTSGLGQKVCKSKGIPIFSTVGEAVTLGEKELAVDGVVIVGEHGEYPTNLKGQCSGRGVGWTYAGEIEGQKDPAIVSMLGWPGPFSQYHASNAQPHWITEMMVTGKEPFHAERLLLSTGIVSYNMESNWENGRYSAIGRRIETPFMNMICRSTRGPQFSKGERPPNVPYIRGFDS